MYNVKTEFLSKWGKLIFCPLDLSVPEISISTFLEWAEGAKETDYNLFKYTTSRASLDKKIMTEEEFAQDRKYGFWSARYALSYQTVANSNNTESEWANNFDKLFPDLVKFYHSLPIKKIKTIGFLIQNKSSNSPPFAPFHIDGPEMFGFRIFLNSKSKGFTMRKIQRSKINFDLGLVNLGQDRFFHHDPKKASINNLNYNIVEKKEFYPQFPNKNCACVLTNFSACHSAYTDAGIGEETKITTLVMSDHKNSLDSYDYEKFDKLLERSVDKYKDFVIWYDDDFL